MCGQKSYVPDALLWQYRRANKLATVAWQRTKKQHMNAALQQEGTAFSGLKNLEEAVKVNPKKSAKIINAYTKQIYDNTVAAWHDLEADYWHLFGMGF
jgi:dipeptidase